jgi:hypothetical protein
MKTIMEKEFERIGKEIGKKWQEKDFKKKK